MRLGSAGLAVFACAALVAFDASGEVSPALVAARRAKSDPALSMLVYQHMDKLFDTRVVKAGGSARRFARSPRTLDGFTYAYDGQSYKWAEFFERTKVNAALVLKNGKVVSEVYRNGSDARTRFITYSMSKSVVSILVGLAIEDRLVGLEDAVTIYLPELKGTAYDSVTIRNLLMMRSGVSWNEAYAPGTVLDQVRDAAINQSTAYYEDYAFKAARAVEPGSNFEYSTLDAGVLGWALERAVKRPITDYMADRLWKPMGAEADGYWIAEGPEGKQRPWYGAGFNSTLRDFARVGQLMADGGKAGGRQIVPAAWVAQSTSDPANAGYAYLWWPLGGTQGYSARGTYGQALYIDPPTQTVMVVFSFWPPNTNTSKLSGEQNAAFKQMVEALRRE